MKKIFIFSLISLFLPTSIVFADSIEKFHVDIVINKDNTANITETIDYSFSESFRHGIYREIPETFKAKGNFFPIDIKVLEVIDENNVPYKFHNESFGGVDLKIGDPDKYADDLETYIIKYKVDNVIGFFESNDEFYWNLTGNEWDVDYINNISATINFPEKIGGKISEYDYCGITGSTESCGNFSVNGSTAYYYSQKNLNRGEGITIDLEFPKGIVNKPNFFDNILGLILKYYYFPLSFLISIYLFRKIFKNKIKVSKQYKKFKRNHPDLVQYDPGEFSIIEASFFHDGKTTINKDLSAFIVWAAINRYINIEEKEGDYYFNKLEKTDNLKDGPEKELINEFSKLKIVKKFGKSVIISVDTETEGGSIFNLAVGAINNASLRLKIKKISDQLFNVYALKIIDNGFIEDFKIDKIKKRLHKSFGKMNFDQSENYFNLIINTKFSTIFILFFLSINPGIFFIIFLNNLIYGMGYIFSLILIFMAIFIIFFISKVPAYTEKGFKASWYINGLYKYINMSERERIKVANELEKTPVLFEKLLPYAIVFGLEEKWVKEFEGIYNDLDWFKTSSSSGFNAGFLTGFTSSLSSATQSATSSGSSSGGGSSGGGGGGGGGGSW